MGRIAWVLCWCLVVAATGCNDRADGESQAASETGESFQQWLPASVEVPSTFVDQGLQLGAAWPAEATLEEAWPIRSPALFRALSREVDFDGRRVIFSPFVERAAYGSGAVARVGWALDVTEADARSLLTAQWGPGTELHSTLVWHDETQHIRASLRPSAHRSGVDIVFGLFQPVEALLTKQGTLGALPNLQLLGSSLDTLGPAIAPFRDTLVDDGSAMRVVLRMPPTEHTVADTIVALDFSPEGACVGLAVDLLEMGPEGNKALLEAFTKHFGAAEKAEFGTTFRTDAFELRDEHEIPPSTRLFLTAR